MLLFQKLKFKDLLEQKISVGIKKGYEYSFVPMENVKSGSKFPAFTEFKKFTGGGARFADGDTLFARITPCLQNKKIVQVKNLKNGIGFGSTEFFVFRAKKGYTNQDYLYYILKTEDLISTAISSMVGASGRQRADIKSIYEYEVNAPDLKVQTHIASILSAYDDLIENNEKRIKVLDEMAQLLYAEWFKKLKFPGHEKVKMVDSGTEYGLIPEGWEVGSLDNISTLMKRKYIMEDDIDLPLVDMSRINSHSLSITNTGHSSELSTSRIIFEEYDILFGSIRPYLYKVALAPFKGVTNVSVFVLRAQESYLKAFQAVTLYREETVKWANHHSAGTKMPVIKWELFKKMPVLIPEKDILEKFEDVVGSVLDLINELSILNKNLSKTRDLLIPQLVTGKRELKHAK